MGSGVIHFRAAAASALALAIVCGGLSEAPATAQASPGEQADSDFPYANDLTYLPPVDTSYQPGRTAWGDPDLRGMWPLDSLGGVPLQRPKDQGDRVWLTDEEYAEREAAMEKSRNAAQAETASNKLGLGNWVEMTGAGRRTSLLVDPPNGRLPELTPLGKELQTQGRSSWVEGQTFDWVTDFNAWDRCITRGHPSSMLPYRYNNGVRIWQAPGYVVIDLEMIHEARIIPIGDTPPLHDAVKAWTGVSRGRWEGNTLVVETTNIQPGASAIGFPGTDTIPMSEEARFVERLTMTGPDSLTYEMTFYDPEVWTAPFTIRENWTRNADYEFFEYACHEGNVQIRNYITASRAERAKAGGQQTEGASR